jgi:glycosyltransferase involved in cell wall biosynthesis
VNVLQVVHGFPPFNQAGAELFAHGLARHLRSAGHDVQVFHRIADPEREEYAVERSEVDGLPVIRVNNTFRQCDRFERTYRNDTIDGIFGGVLDEQQPDVVHFHHVTCLSTNLIAEAHRRGIPMVYTLHDFWLICQRGQFLKRDLSVCPGQEDRECVDCLSWQLGLGPARRKAAGVVAGRLQGGAGAALRRVVKGVHGLYARNLAAGTKARARVHQRMEHVRSMCSLVSRFVAPSRFLKQRYVEFGIPDGRITYSRYGFETSYYSDQRRSPDGDVRFGYLGTWIPPKGVHVLIEAFNGIATPRASLHLYGHALPYEGHEDYEEHLRGLIRSPRIHLEGAYGNEDVGRILAGLDVLVVPSIWYENSPLTIQEAMLAGVPVITSDLGGMAELVRDGENGLTFRPRDAVDLRRKMQQLIDDPGLLRKLRPRRDEVKELSTCAREHEALYRELT